MNKVIDGHVYNTETAQLLGEDSYSNSSDFHHWSERLYKNKRGWYFLYGEGGPLSEYSEMVGQNEWSGSEKIKALTEEEAKKWVEDHLSGDDYERIFGDPGEERMLTIRTTDRVAEKFNAAKDSMGMKADKFLEYLIDSKEAKNR